jgi:hypothetical protein
MPPPDTETVNTGFSSNVAVTVFEPFIVTGHVTLDPLHAPPQPVNVAVAGSHVAVSVTLVPES